MSDPPKKYLDGICYLAYDKENVVFFNKER